MDKPAAPVERRRAVDLSSHLRSGVGRGCTKETSGEGTPNGGTVHPPAERARK
jgi:hypothetical protein